jgi:hypothetical protein
LGLLASAVLAGCQSLSHPPTVRVRGVIESISLFSRTLVVLPEDTTTAVTLAWNEHTMFLENKVPIRPADVQTGFWANVDCRVLPAGGEARRVFVEAPWFRRH